MGVLPGSGKDAAIATDRGTSYNLAKCKDSRMSEATMTSKGQVTIPVDIRKSMAIGPKDRLTFTPMPDGTVVMRAKTKSLLDIKGLLKPGPGVAVAIADMRLGGD